MRFDRPADSATARVLDLIQLLGLSQAVVSCSQSSHTLDPRIYKKDEQVFRSVSPRHTLSSDRNYQWCATWTLPSRLRAVPWSRPKTIVEALTTLSSRQTSL